MSRWRLLIVPVLVVPLAWLLFTGLGRDPRTIPSPLVGKPLPALAGTTLEGRAWNSAALAGKQHPVAEVEPQGVRGTRWANTRLRHRTPSIELWWNIAI